MEIREISRKLQGLVGDKRFKYKTQGLYQTIAAERKFIEWNQTIAIQIKRTEKTKEIGDQKDSKRNIKDNKAWISSNN